MAAISPYKTAAALNRPAPDWTPNKDDQSRIQSYDTYDDIWNNVPEAFKALLREDDGGEIGRRYVAAARMIISATHRYLGKDLQWVPTDPPGATVPEATRDVAMQALDALFKREEFMAKFSALKRWMLIRGDALLHVTADPLKPEGTRLRITELHPRTYFPIMDGVDRERVTGCYIVTIVTEGPDATPVAAQRLEYHRVLTEEDQAGTTGAGIGSVWYRLGFFELDGWDDRIPFTAEDLAPVDVPESIPRNDAVAALMAGAVLPPAVTALPVYHFRNQRRGTETFGTSELQGIETVLAGLTQTATDEDLAIGLAGIGVYVTDDDEPAKGEPDPIVAPASVLYVAEGRTFTRVAGVDKVDALQDHFALLKASAQEVTGVPDVAVGKVDVQTAQSGIALAIQMAPVISKNEDTEMELIGKLGHLVYDLLTGWLPAYEGLNAGGLIVNPSFGSALPVNRKETLDEVLAMLVGKIISAEFARQTISEKLGYSFPDSMLAAIVAEQGAMLDSVGARMDQEQAAPEDIA